MAILGRSEIQDVANFYKSRNDKFIGFIDHAAGTLDAFEIDDLSLVAVDRTSLQFSYTGCIFELRHLFTPPDNSRICLYRQKLDGMLHEVTGFDIKQGDKVDVLDPKNLAYDITLEHEEIFSHFLLAAAGKKKYRY